MAELDILLVPFFEEVFEELEDHEKQTFIHLLEQDDPDLLFWFSQKGVPEDPALAALVARILDRVQP